MEMLTGVMTPTLMVTLLEVAGLPEGHVTEEVRTQLTTSPFSGLKVNVEALVPALTAFTFHWYCGEVPPLIGVALKVTGVPSQTGFAEGEMLIPTVDVGFTVMVTVFDVAGFPVVHARFEVTTQLTISLVTGAYVYTALLVPTLVPFTFHWYTGEVPPLTGVAVNET
jgi:hypothetical protein